MLSITGETKSLSRSPREGDDMNHNRFWIWFCRNADAITRNYDDEILINELDNEVFLSWPRLCWEIGPDSSEGWYFALSPNLDRDMAEIAKEAIRYAPKIPGWKFYATRQRKSWNGQFEFSTPQGIIEIDSSKWEYVLLRYPDGVCEIFLIGSESGLLSDDERSQAAAIVVEGMLGENCILSNNLVFTLSNVIEKQFIGKQKPILDLPRAFGFN